ncbi:hypothetical protein EV421DRAFT_1908219 [Armillaria borealis]|uniref:Uncharacterized protein n=1 Tax=Armillaria borealis TaxID=47425 RepID=A0AA39MJM7_9AGAR|nr:hypothetical protein EV421DRAFT_1908219 [Armillaria borealis]
MTTIKSHVPITRYRHMQPRPGKNKRVELSLWKAALASRIQNKIHSIITDSVTSTRTSRPNPCRRRRHTAPIATSQPSHTSCISLTMDPDDHAASDSSQVPSGIQNDAPTREHTLEYGLCPRYTRGYLWQDPDSLNWDTPMTTATWTETLLPMPQLPQNELNNHVALDTIKLHPALFHIVTPINITRFREFLDSHPNQELVFSVCVGLETGFWPWADTNNPRYPTTNDNSFRPLKDHSHVDLVRSQRDTEIDLGRFSHYESE